MSCENFREMISAFIDNELDENEVDILQTHLRSCSDCNRLLNELLTMSGINRKMHNIPMPPEVADNILKLTVKSERKWLFPLTYITGFWRIPRGLAWVGVLAILYVVGDLLPFGNRSPMQPPQIELSQTKAEETVRRVVISDEDLVLTTVKIQPKLKI
jgi:hypothetical protein